MKKKSRILLVEDEPDMALIVADTLRGEGFDVLSASDGIAGFEYFQSVGADIIVADVMMPKLDGFSMVREIRKMSPTVPIIFLTAKSAIEDLEKGFALGGDDYLKKPFELRELIVRVKALLRHVFSMDEVEKYSIGRFSFNASAQTLSIDGESRELSHFEAEALKMLATDMGKTVDASRLMIALWGSDGPCNRNSLHGYIHKLRHLLSKDPSITIINQRGFGYRLSVNVT